MYTSWKQVRLEEGIAARRAALNRAYVLSLKAENLLQNHYYEAGLWTPWERPCDCHGGWEFPTSSVKGQFLGHWMSAAARLYRNNNDLEAHAKLCHIVDELEKCQARNGGRWVNSNPVKYLEWALQGKTVGVPHYVIHKTMMGLWEAYAYAGIQKALKILLNFADFFVDFTRDLRDADMDDLLDIETGGMMEVFAELYGLTGEEKHGELMRKYTRRRLFDPLLAGEDRLSNMHANTTVPEALGMARAYEVTGDRRYLDSVLAYWDIAVTRRGTYATGSANSGEIWCPPLDFFSRLGEKTQEHCTQYNMIRLADFLLRHTGNAVYADFIERSLYNAVFAQQNPQTGMVCYYLPLAPGSRKVWGTPTETFWCCHGSLVQAHTLINDWMGYCCDRTLVLSQYFPFEATVDLSGEAVSVALSEVSQGGDTQAVVHFDPGAPRKPSETIYQLQLSKEAAGSYALQLRIPWWVKRTRILLDGRELEIKASPSTMLAVEIPGGGPHELRIAFTRAIEFVPLAEDPSIGAIMDGPVTLAALCEDMPGIALRSDGRIEGIRPLDARHWRIWRNEYWLQNGARGLRLMPIHEITDQTYSVYFRRESDG